MTDNKQHKIERDTCRTCKFCEEAFGRAAGYCHRFPSRSGGVLLNDIDTDWCGEYVRKET